MSSTHDNNRNADACLWVPCTNTHIISLQLSEHWLLYTVNFVCDTVHAHFSDESIYSIYMHELYSYVLGMGGGDILAYDYCKAKISRLSRLLLQLYLC